LILHLPPMTPMLRISINESEGNVVTLRLEGQIAGAWISELKEACERMLTAGYKVTLDLGDVGQVDKFRGRSAERSWLCGILKNKICDYFRKLGRETNFTDLEFFSDEHSDRFDGENYWIHERGPADWKSEGEEAMKRAEFWQAIRASLDRLPPRVAQVFMMREMDDIPSKEVCEMLNISEANLWVMLHRARMALRQDLELTFFESSGGTKL